MTDQTDFMVLYFELGVGPDCSMDGLRLAYRRRVADLHPDRCGDAGADALKALNKRYAAAIDFHRHHGRLPGAPASAPAPASRRQAWAEPPPLVAVAASERLPRQRRRRSKFFMYGMAVMAFGAWWLSRTDAPLPQFLDGFAGDQREIRGSAAMALHPGMHAHEVVEMLGDPVDRTLGGTHWEYGPSWVRFACGRVVDWYSSPLRPLRASRSRPADMGGSASTQLAPRCPPSP